MKVENLRSLIRENIHSYLKEIDEAAKIGAIKASITKCEEAIGVREKKMNMEGLDEAYHDMLDKGKMAELKSEIKALSKSLEKYKKQLAKFEKVDEVTDEVVTDEAMVTDEVTEEAPIATEDVMAEMNVDNETAINESFLKMQKLAGVITEAEYNKKKSLIENQSDIALSKKSMNEEDSRIKQISDRDMYSVKEPNSAVLVNGEKPFSLSQEELKPIKDAAGKPNIDKFKRMVSLSPDDATLSLANKKSEQRILKFFKSDKDTYYITVVGPGETSFNRTKHYTTNDKSAFIEFVNKIINEFSDWCDAQL